MKPTSFEAKVYKQFFVERIQSRGLAGTDDDCFGVLEPLLNPRDDPPSYIPAANLIRGVDGHDVFKDCVDSFALAYCEHFEGLEFTNSHGTNVTTHDLVKSLEDVLLGLVSRERFGLSIASSEVSGALCNLADSMKQVAHKCLYGDAPPRHQDQLFHDMRSQPVLGARLCGILIPTAQKSASYPIGVKILKDSNKNIEEPFGNGASNIMFACRALVFACHWLVDMVERLRPCSRRSTGKAHTKLLQEIQETFELHVESLCPFVSMAMTDWSHVEKAWLSMTTLASSSSGAPLAASLEDSLSDHKSPQHRQALETLCLGFGLSPVDCWDPKDGTPSRLPVGLFDATYKSLGLACWEIFDTLNFSTHGADDKAHQLGRKMKKLVEEMQSAIKVLMDCDARGFQWVERLGDLADGLRRVAEKLIEAAYIHVLYQKPEDLKNKDGGSLVWSEMADRLESRSRNPKNDSCGKNEARSLAALWRTAQTHCSSAGVHSDPPSDEAREHARNKANNITIGCRSVVFSCMWLAHLINAVAGRDTRQPVQAEDLNTWLIDLHLQHQPRKDPTLTAEVLIENLKALFRQACDGEQDIESALRIAKGLKRELKKLDPGSPEECNALDDMREDFKYAVAYLMGSIRSSSIWLQRILSKKDDYLYSSIIRRLWQRAERLKALYAPKHYRREAYERLEAFQKRLSVMEQSSRELMAARDRIRGCLLDDHGHLGRFAVSISKLKGAALRSAGEEDNEVLVQAVAVARAMQSKGCHLALHHPDILVMWYRVDGLKERDNMECLHFLCHLRTTLVVPKAVQREVIDSLDVAEQPLKQRLVCREDLVLEGDRDGDDKWAPVFIRDVNRVFECGVSVPAAIRACLHVSPPSPSPGQGPATPEQRSEGSVRGFGFASSSVASSTSGHEEDEDEPHLFILRERELMAAMEVLSGSAGERHLLLTGRGGIGKSTLAYNIKEEMRGKGRLAGTFEVDLFQAHTPEAVLEALCSSVGISGMVNEVTRVKTEVLMRLRLHLERHGSDQGSPMLLLSLDSCEVALKNPTAADALADVLLHVMRFPQVRVLMAAHAFVCPSSAQQASRLRRELYELEVDKLDLEDAKAILRRGFRNKGYQQEYESRAEAVARLCDCIPLHLTLAAGILSFSPTGYEGIQRTLEGVAQKRTTIEAALLWGHKNEHLEALLSLSVFATSFSTRQAERMLFDHPAADVPTLLQMLHRHRLLMAVPASGEGMWKLHQSVRAAVRQLAYTESQGGQQQQQQQQRYQEILTSAPVRFTQCMMAELAMCALSSPREATRIALEQQANFIEALQPSEHTAELKSAVAQSLLQEWESFGGKPSKWLNSTGRVSALLLPGLHHLCQALQAASATNLGAELEAGARQGWADDEAVNALASCCKVKQSAAGEPQLQPPEPMSVSQQHTLAWLHATAHNLQAHVMSAAGLCEGAAELWRGVLDQCIRLKGPKHPATLTTKSNLASTVLHQGQLGKAEDEYRQVLRQHIMLRGPEHPHTITAKANLATALQKQGSKSKLDEAEGLHWEALEQRSRVLGQEHPDTLASIHNLSTALSSQGKLTEAQKWQDRGLEQCRLALGPEDPLTLIFMGNLASTLWRQRKFAEAEVLQRQVQDLQSRMLGPAHPHALTSLHNLATMLWSQRKLEEAEVLQRQVVKQREMVLGAGHIETHTSKGTLAITLADGNKLEEAEDLQRQVLKQQSDLLGPGHPHTVSTIGFLATTLQRQDKHEASAELLHQMIEKQGPGHPHTPCAAQMLKQMLKQSLYMWAETSPKLSLSQALCFSSAAQMSCEHVPDSAFPEPLRECVGKWCKLLHASGAKDEANKLAKRAFECCPIS